MDNAPAAALLVAVTLAAAPTHALDSLSALAAGSEPELGAVLTEVSARKEEAARYRRHQVRFTGELGLFLRQPVVVTMSFEMQEAHPLHYRLIRDLTYRVELLPYAPLSLPGYVQTSRGPVSGPFAYADPSREGVNFYFELLAHVDPGAAGTELDGVLGRTQSGQVYGQDTRLVMMPYCNKDLSKCRLGTIAGFTNRPPFPNHRLFSDDVFSMSAQ